MCEIVWVVETRAYQRDTLRAPGTTDTPPLIILVVQRNQRVFKPGRNHTYRMTHVSLKLGVACIRSLNSYEHGQPYTYVQLTTSTQKC